MIGSYGISELLNSTAKGLIKWLFTDKLDRHNLRGASSKILSVVCARPNFMKIAPIVDALKSSLTCSIAWSTPVNSTTNFSLEVFFTELGLPLPDVNLHALEATPSKPPRSWRLEPVPLEYQPDMVVVVGDVNSTLATAITAVKLGNRVAHVEAGLLSFDQTMPEEINRKLTDAISNFLFVAEQSGIENLRHDGISEEKLFLVADVIIDPLLRHREVAAGSPILDQLHLRNGSGLKPHGIFSPWITRRTSGSARRAQERASIPRIAVRRGKIFSARRA